MTYAPRLLDQIVSLTSLRDVDLLELSLLKTLNSYINPSHIHLIRVSRDNTPRAVVEFKNSSCESIDAGPFRTAEYRRAMDIMDHSNSIEHTSRIGGQVVNLYRLKKGTSSATYLSITIRDVLSGLDAYLISGIIKVHANYCLLLEDSQKDQLTGLLNRKTFDETITKVYDLVYTAENKRGVGEQRNSKNDSFWMVMIDIDHFKSVNDNYGHLYGDEVLLLVAQVIQNSFRDEDLIFRFGGEEFVVLLKSESKETCHKALDRLRRDVETHEIPQVGKMTISIGVTQMKSNTFHVTLLDYADKALYSSKQNGRNKITFFEDLIDSGEAREEEIIDSNDVDLFN